MQRLRLNASLPEVIADPSYARHAWTFGKPTKQRDMPDCRSPCRLAPYLVQIDVPVILLLLKLSAEIFVLFGASIHNEDLLIFLSMPGSGPEKPIFRGHEQLQGILIPYFKNLLQIRLLLWLLDRAVPFTTRRLVQVKPESCTDFEDVWKNRKSTLLETPGFIRFALLKGDEEGAQKSPQRAAASLYSTQSASCQGRIPVHRIR